MRRRRRPRVTSHRRSQSSRRPRPNKVTRDHATADRSRSYADVQRSKADNAVGIRFENAPPVYDRFVYHAEARRPRRPHSREIKSRRPKRPAARSESERHDAGAHEAVRHERRRSRHSTATVSHTTERPHRRRSRRPKSSSDLEGQSTFSPHTSATGKRTERTKRSIMIPSQSLADEPVFQDALPAPPCGTDDTKAISQRSVMTAPSYRLSFLGGLSAFRDPVKQNRKFDEKQRKRQLKEQALQARKEANDQRAAEKEKLARKRKVAALVAQQKRDAAKARRKQEKEDKKNEAQMARQAKASEAFMLAQQRERERSCLSWDANSVVSCPLRRFVLGIRRSRVRDWLLCSVIFWSRPLS